jgi:ribosomal protein S18 acetylase RimI-like enzyme
MTPLATPESVAVRAIQAALASRPCTQLRSGRRTAAPVGNDVAMPSFERFEPSHLDGVVALCEAEGWPSLPADPDRALRVLTAPGVTTVVAVDAGMVVGFAQMFSDGELQAFLATLAVAASERGKGVARALVVESLRLAGGASTS